MILCSLDFETTGLSAEKDRVIEIGAILYSSGQKRCLDSFGRFVKSDVPISAETTNLTGIHQNSLDRFGWPEEDSFEILRDMIGQSDAVIGHNIIRFDMPMLRGWARRLGKEKEIPDVLLIDTMTDLPGVEGNKLSYLAADHKILNYFPHSALADCQTVLTVLEAHDFEKVVERAKTPSLVLVAHTQYSENHLVKAAKFRWCPPRKQWWKSVKECDVEKLMDSVQFRVTIEKDLSPEDMEEPR